MPAKTKYETRAKILKLGFKQLPQIDIAKKCNIGRLTVHRLLKKNNIKHGENSSYAFWNKIKVLGNNDCWEWRAFKDKDGYGQYSSWKDGDEQRVHRIMWILKFGSIPKGALVCHKCDNPSCCNPNHLFLGTHRDNMKDMVKKGRVGCVKGENHGCSKLTIQQVLEIRSKYVTGKYLQRQLAVEYGVDRTTISSVVNRKIWRHI